MDYHPDRFVDASWFVLLNERPIAVRPVSGHGDGLVPHGGLSFGGLVPTRKLTTVRAHRAR
jgi:hypothetical protein